MSAANDPHDPFGEHARGRATSRPRLPSMAPSFPLASKETGRIVTHVVTPEPHRGWHSRGYLPHWDHPGMIQSLNFRLGDAMPREVLDRWKSELGLVHPAGSAAVSPAGEFRWDASAPERRRRRDASAPGRGGRRDASAPGRRGRRDASAPGDRGTPDEQQRQIELRRRVEEYLDAGHGACWLRRPEVAALVEGALRHFDGERYRLLAWCVMPNHVHALIETREGFPLADVLHSWKSFTSRVAGERVGRNGPFWQREYLDRYVRNAEHYQAVVVYIEENPVNAGLAKVKTDWPWSSARFRDPGSAGVSPASRTKRTT